jgi:preprotein translocase subunit SecY
VSDYPLVQQCISGADTARALGLINLFSGGALLQLSIFALGIMPYITASIIVQLLTVVIPRFEALKKEGQAGQTKMTQYTRYLTIGLASCSPTLITFALAPAPPGSSSAAATNDHPNDSVVTILIMVLTMTAGTALIMWFGELITERGIGNGMSAADLHLDRRRPSRARCGRSSRPGAGRLHRHHPRRRLRRHGLRGLRRAVSAPDPGAVRQAHGGAADVRRHLDLHPAQGQHGRRHPGHLRRRRCWPCPCCSRSSTAAGRTAGTRLGQSWSEQPRVAATSPVYMVIYFGADPLLHVLLRVDHLQPVEVADNMKKYGGFIPGIRAGRPTAEYLDYVLTRITAPGLALPRPHLAHPADRLRLVGCQPELPLRRHLLLIIVGVGLETVKQIEAQLQQRNYEGFLR